MGNFLVDKFHLNDLNNGGTDEVKPGFRPPSYPDTYYAYVRDPDNNKLCAYYD